MSNWSPFAPNGFKAIVTGATVVFFAYVGFDAVANSAEESRSPQVCQSDICQKDVTMLVYTTLLCLQCT